MKKENKKYWFRAKWYGWGWYPSSWQGWLILLAWAVMFTTAIVKMDHEWLKNLLFIFLITGILIYICYRTGKNLDGDGEENE
jgi:hypothetical protein